MAHVNARQWQRFAYRADVQLRWDAALSSSPAAGAARRPIDPAAGAARRPIDSAAGAAQAGVSQPPASDEDVQGGVCVNLGRGGMQVRADAAPEVGAAVSCKLWFAGDWTTLPGFVRWTRTDPQLGLGKELGIEFGPLSPEQSESIGDLVASAEHGGRHVRVRVPGLRDPLEALAVPTDRGLRIRAPLRLFAAGSDLDVELPDASLRFGGRVLGSQLRARAGNEHWELELLIEERGAPRSRRYTMHGAPGAPRGSFNAARKLRSRAETLIVSRPSEFSRMRWFVTMLAFTIAALGTATLVSIAPRRTSQHLAKPVQPLPPLAAKVHAAAGPKAREPEAPQHTLVTATPSAAAPLAEAPAADSDNAPGRRAQPASEPATTEDSVQFVADEPSIEVSADVTRVFVPVRGALERMHSALWVEPLALVIDLPDTEVTLARSRYVLRAGGVSALSVGTSRGVTQLRLFLDALLARYSIQPAPGGLAIQLKRDLRPMP